MKQVQKTRTWLPWQRPAALLWPSCPDRVLTQSLWRTKSWPLSAAAAAAGQAGAPQADRSVSN